MKKQLILGLLTLVGTVQSVVAQTTLRGDSLQEVVVTGTGTQHLLKDAPVQTEVISRQQLQMYAGRSIEDILSGLTASFDFNENDMGSHLQMNGLGNSYVLILIDGRRLHGDNGGENDLSLIDPHNIEKIEIVKGASSALYGSDAIAGVINIITRKHREQGVMVENTSRIGSYGDIRQHNGLALNFGKLSSYTNFQLQHSDGWQNTGEEDPRQTEFHIYDSSNKTVNRHTNWQVAERLTYKLLPSLELYADGSVYWKRIYRLCGKYPAVDVKTYDMEYHNASASIGGQWRLNETDVITLDADWKRHAYYYNFTDTTLTDGYDDHGRFTQYYPWFPGQKELQSDQQLTMVSLKGVFTLPYDQRLSVGADYRYDWLKAPMRVADGKATDQTQALYLQDELSLVSSQTLAANVTAGLRLTHNHQFGTRLTPKLSAMLKLSDLRLRATWSQGYKTPTPKELYYRYVRYMNATYLYMGNTDLKPQTSNYYGLSAECTIGRLTMTLSGYYNKVGDMITLVTIPRSDVPGDLLVTYDPRKIRQYQNIDDAETFGADFTLRYQARDFTFGGSYSYLDTRANQYDADHETVKRVTIDGMAHHKANWYVTWQRQLAPAYRLGLGLYGRMSTKRYYQTDGNGKGYQIWRVATSHDLTRPNRPLALKVEAGVDNVFDYVDRTPHGLHLGTNSPGRTVYATLSVRFNHGKKLRNIYKQPSNYKQNNEED